MSWLGRLLRYLKSWTNLVVCHSTLLDFLLCSQNRHLHIETVLLLPKIEWPIILNYFLAAQRLIFSLKTDVCSFKNPWAINAFAPWSSLLKILCNHYCAHTIKGKAVLVSQQVSPVCMNGFLCFACFCFCWFSPSPLIRALSPCDPDCTAVVCNAWLRILYVWVSAGLSLCKCVVEAAN